MFGQSICVTLPRNRTRLEPLGPIPPPHKYGHTLLSWCGGRGGRRTIIIACLPVPGHVVCVSVSSGQDLFFFFVLTLHSGVARRGGTTIKSVPERYQRETGRAIRKNIIFVEIRHFKRASRR